MLLRLLSAARSSQQQQSFSHAAPPACADEPLQHIAIAWETTCEGRGMPTIGQDGGVNVSGAACVRLGNVVPMARVQDARFGDHANVTVPCLLHGQPPLASSSSRLGGCVGCPADMPPCVTIVPWNTDPAGVNGTAHLGINPFVTLEKQLLNIIGNLV
jgi:hypothetical protein